MVGAPRSPSLPPSGPAIDVFMLNGGHSRISITASQGAVIDIFMLMVGAPGSPTLPPRGLAEDIFTLNGGHSQISVIASKGGPPLTFSC
jgi:hypothetical protein